jgi:glycosyltransferase involved in cell wall biosynthesis
LPDTWTSIAATVPGSLRRLLPEAARHALLVGLIGAIEPGKGQQVLVEAIPRVLERCANVLFVLVGRICDHAFAQNLRNRVDQLGIADQVKFTGELSDMPTVYADLDVVAQASYTEGLPLVVMEGMCMGKPVVATQVGGTPELIRNQQTGILIPPGDPEALADALLAVLTSPVVRRRLSSAARTYARARFTMAPALDRLEMLYREVAARARRRYPVH